MVFDEPVVDPVASLRASGQLQRRAASAEPCGWRRFSRAARPGAERSRGRPGARRRRPTRAGAGRADRDVEVHRPPGQPGLPGRRPARGASNVRRDQWPEHRHRPDDRREPWTWRCATCRGIRRSTSSCAPTSSDTSWTARSCASPRSRSSSDEESQRRKLTDEQALAGELRVLTKALSYAKSGGPREAAQGHGAVEARVDSDGSAHEHAHHQRPARTAGTGIRPPHDPRRAAAAGRDRGAHRPDHS